MNEVMLQRRTRKPLVYSKCPRKKKRTFQINFLELNRRFCSYFYHFLKVKFVMMKNYSTNERMLLKIFKDIQEQNMDPLLFEDIEIWNEYHWKYLTETMKILF